MDKAKQTIGASLALALVLSVSLPGGVFALNIRAAESVVGTPAGGIAGLPADHQFQLAANIKTLIMPLSRSPFPGAEELVGAIGNQISQPGLAPIQIAAGKTTLAALADPKFAAQTVVDLAKVSHAESPEIGKQAAGALVRFIKIYDSDAVYGAAAKAAADLGIDPDALFDGLAAGGAAEKTLFARALDASEAGRAGHLATHQEVVDEKVSYGIKESNPILESRLVHHAIIQAVVAQGNKRQADVLDLVGRFIDLPMETKTSIVEDSVANLIRLVGDKINLAHQLT